MTEEKKEPWEMTKDEIILQTPLAQKLKPFIEKAAAGEKVEIKTTDINPSLPKARLLIYSNKVSKANSFYDDTSNTIYLNIDKPSDIATKILQLKDKTAQSLYTLLHEIEHVRQKETYGEALVDVGLSEKAQRIAIKTSKLADNFFRTVLEKHRHIIEEALKEGKPVPPEVLKDYPDLAEKYGKPPEKPKEGKTREEKECVTLQTWRRWNKKGLIKVIQYGGIYKGENYPMIFEKDGKYYKEANEVAPSYYYCYVPAKKEDFRPDVLERLKLTKESGVETTPKMTPTKKLLERYEEKLRRGELDDVGKLFLWYLRKKAGVIR